MKRKVVVYLLTLALLFGSAVFNSQHCPRTDLPSCLQYSFGGWMVRP